MLFLDSTFLIGIILKKDTFTSKALKLIPLIKKEKKIINSVVFNEVLNSLTATNSEYDVDDVIDILLSYEIDFLNEKDYAQAASIFKYYNHAINFSDCTIIKTMQDHQINKIVSFDNDFDKINGINRIYL